MINTTDMSEVNRLENSMGEDLDPKWNEPSTRGDLRLLAMRIDTMFEQLRGDFRLHTTGTDAKFEQFRVELMHSMYRAGRIFFGAIISTILIAFGIFAILVK